MQVGDSGLGSRPCRFTEDLLLMAEFLQSSCNVIFRVWDPGKVDMDR